MIDFIDRILGDPRMITGVIGVVVLLVANWSRVSAFVFPKHVVEVENDVSNIAVAFQLVRERLERYGTAADREYFDKNIAGVAFRTSLQEEKKDGVSA
jgi:hypothetical protein